MEPVFLAAWFCSASNARSRGVYWSIFAPALIPVVYPEAIEYGKRALEIDAGFYSVWFLIGLAQVGAGLFQEAIGSFRSGVELAPWYPEGQWYLAAAYHLAGDRQCSEELARKLNGQHGHTLGAASFYAMVGEADAMFTALDAAYCRRDPRLHFVNKRPIFDAYRDDRRLKDLLGRMNLSERPS